MRHFSRQFYNSVRRIRVTGPIVTSRLLLSLGYVEQKKKLRYFGSSVRKRERISIETMRARTGNLRYLFPGYTT